MAEIKFGICDTCGVRKEFSGYRCPTGWYNGGFQKIYCSCINEGVTYTDSKLFCSLICLRKFIIGHLNCVKEYFMKEIDRLVHLQEVMEL